MKKSFVVLVAILVVLVIYGVISGGHEAIRSVMTPRATTKPQTRFPTIQSRPTTRPTSPPEPTDEPKPTATRWFSGGTLHKATFGEWMEATEENRRATAADWVTATKGWDSLEELSELTNELVYCVTETSADFEPEELHDLGLEVNELVALCIVLMWGG